MRIVMIQFDIKRFGKLVRWSLVNDKRYYIKSTLQIFAVLVFFFLFFITVVKPVNSYEICSLMVMFMFGANLVMGSSFMFYSMEGRHDRQNLMMLPASNFEKYLMRYATWLILLPLYIVAFLGADLLQYVVNLLAGHEKVTFVAVTLVNGIRRMMEPRMHDNLGPTFLNSLLIILVWFHSLYALGATFFRARKYNWVLTTIVIILLLSLQAWLFPFEQFVNDSARYDRAVLDVLVTDLVTFCWIVLNFWLSYKLFCRQQVIGKFVNV